MSTLAVTQEWSCPNGCRPNVRTRGAWLPNRFHTCPKLRMMTAPMVPAGTSAKVELVARQDYVGREVVTRDAEGGVPMSVVTTRDDGQDVAVFAPMATAHEGVRRKPRKLLLPRRRR